MFEKLKKLFGIAEQDKKATEPAKQRRAKGTKTKKEKTLTPMEIATANNEPYVAIESMRVDPNDINNGEFHIIWNDKFLVNLIKAGYKFKPDDTDQMIVDRWFQHVCRNVALEIYEQYQADPSNRGLDNVRPPSNVRNLGNGRSEIS